MNVNNPMSQKTLLSFFFLFFLFSSFFLFHQNQNKLDPDAGKNWWTLAFISLEKDEKIDFFVENHSDQNNFSYEIYVGKEMIAKDNFIAKSKEKTVVRVPSIKPQSERIRIIVDNGKEKKEIYK